MNEVPPKIASLLAVWHRSAINYMALGFSLLAISIVTSLAITAYADTLPLIWIKTLGFAAAVSTALLASFGPIQVGYAFRSAWRALNSACLSYELGPTPPDNAKLIAAIDSGELIIGGVPMPVKRLGDAAADAKEGQWLTIGSSRRPGLRGFAAPAGPRLNRSVRAC